MAFRTNKMPVLQEKSASGAVATFNTALAMPLASCSIAVNAWQEGSGDPSPDNVRTIVPFSALKIRRCGVNLWNFDDPDIIIGYYANGYLFPTQNWRSLFFPCKQGDTFVKSGDGWGGIITFWKDTQFVSQINNMTCTIPDGVNRVSFACQVSAQDAQLEFSDTATPYTPFNGEVKTVNLGQEVYGAEVDLDSGKLLIDTVYFELGTKNWSFTNNWFICTDTLENIVKPASNYGTPKILCSNYKPKSVNSETDLCISISTGSKIWIRDLSYSGNLTDFLSDNEHTQIVYWLTSPIEIQLTPTQIETLIGNNTIFADTGDIDLTYKDLDIAKRGSFREVFKLPS